MASFCLSFHTSNSVSSYRPALTKIKTCDGLLEHKNYEKRFADHLKVFSRNYLYQIECTVSPYLFIQHKSAKHILNSFCFSHKLQIAEIQQPLTYHDFTTKVFSCYELIYHGLNAFVRNLYHFVGIHVPEKLSKLLACINQATNLCVQFDFFDRQDSIVVVSARNLKRNWRFFCCCLILEYYFHSRC